MQPLLSKWSKRHAFVDHLARASESILFNLVEAARLRQTDKKRLAVDYALGSTFECAACLDIATLKSLLDHSAGIIQKNHLLEVSKMLIGLRNSWKPHKFEENKSTYSTKETDQTHSTVFHHEKLDMYTVTLTFYRWFISTESGDALSSTFVRSIDALATRVLLNIAEGNGRYAELSRQSFLDMANSAAVKLAVSLDMGARRGLWSQQEIAQNKHLLLRVAKMTAKKDY
jgi:four helix bundle protein